jgi:hypothetical protein
MGWFDPFGGMSVSFPPGLMGLPAFVVMFRQPVVAGR